ncbi:MAG TPA: hypothetical protein VJB99_01180 [Patescibacteria group bacterium]|nr:hypothetical protein [Patescibacteria group bacterium]
MNGDAAVNRYNDLFFGVPLWGGQEWRTMQPEDLTKEIFLPALDEVMAILEEKHTDAMTALNNYHALPWWKKLFSKRPPKPQPLPTRGEIIAEMASRCRELANWMDANRSRRFYVGSDMSAFIRGPRTVARLLEQQT